MKKSSPTYGVFKRPISNRNFDSKDQKQAKIFPDFHSLPLCFPNYSKKIRVNTFFAKVFKNIWWLNFKKTLNFETQNHDLQAEFWKRPFFVKPRWFHGGFKFTQLETYLDFGWFHATLEVFFFFRKRFNSKKRPKLGQISPYVGFQEKKE